ncbi:MAG: hypothetical protein JWM59_9 [Verrucomicrobiales bacterium]|nr:hypothetical protein [Verrucomicrobiales bacterium]
MATAALESKNRITARVTTSVQSMLEEAAAFLGVPLNSFLVSAAVEKAGDVLAKERSIKLTPRDAEFLSELMEHPPKPNAYLLAAAAGLKSRAANEPAGDS